jgi:glycosyltransferase involved in cell wall biosynthesis
MSNNSFAPSKPLISVVIPSFKPNWLDLTIWSVLSQSIRDWELIISDDCRSDAVEKVIIKWKDPRIKFYKNPNIGIRGANFNNLLALASGEYIKFLWDDDFLLPNSLEILLNIHEKTNCALAFHNRFFIDEFGMLIGKPAFLEGSGYLEITKEIFFKQLIARNINPIGEPSNIMVNASIFKKMNSPFPIGVEGRDMRFLDDIALYTNIIKENLGLYGDAQFGSCFRMHANQNSGINSPIFTAGNYEWDLIRRWSVDNKFLTPEESASGHQLSQIEYIKLLERYPEIGNFLETPHMPIEGKYLSNQFLDALRLADNELDKRLTTK